VDIRLNHKIAIPKAQKLLTQKMSPSQDITVNAAEVTHHVILAIEYFVAVLFET
jgi:hypothetical protein